MDQKYEALHKRVQAVLVPALDRAGYTVVTDIQTDESRETGDPTVRLVIRDESAGFIMRFVVEDLLNLPEAELDKQLMGFVRIWLTDSTAYRNASLKDGRFLDFDRMRENIFIRLQDPHLCPDLTVRCPFRRVMDDEMIAVYRIAMNDQNSSNLVSVTVDHKLMKRWNISEEELWAQALNNLKGEEPRLLLCDALIADRNLHNERLNLLPGCRRLQTGAMYVLMCGAGVCNGAREVLNPALMEKIGVMMDGDYYILPSSIHEVMITSVRGRPEGVRDLKRNLREVNETMVSPRDLLSYKVFRYDRRKKCILRAD